MLLSIYTVCVKQCHFCIYPKCCTHTLRGQKQVLKKKKQGYLKSQIIRNLILVTQTFSSYIQSPSTRNVTDKSAGWLFSIPVYNKHDQKVERQMKNRRIPVRLTISSQNRTKTTYFTNHQYSREHRFGKYSFMKSYPTVKKSILKS